MSGVEDLKRRYQNDAAFKAMVDVLFCHIDQLHLSPSEIREAAMFAVYKHEMLFGPSHRGILGHDFEEKWREAGQVQGEGKDG